MSNYKCLDLFCGAGGLSKGFEMAGFKIVAGVDNDEHSLKTYSMNHKGTLAIKHDLSMNLFDKIDQIRYENIDVLIGGPPCQGMSIAGKRISDDPRNKLYKAYIDIVKHFQPKAIVLENVPTIVTLFDGIIAEAIVNDFSMLGYTVTVNTVFASEYGVPQKRRRTFFIALKRDSFIFPAPTTKSQPITTEEAISDLPLLADELGSDEQNYPVKVLSEYQKKMRKNSTVIYNHTAVLHTETTKNIIKLVPDGGNYKNLPLSLQNTRKVNIAWTRMNSKKPSFTIDAGHNHHFHYKANRVPTVRECARIQSFPDDFIFYGNRTSQYRQVGNAVPPLLAFEIAKKLKEYLNV